MPYYLIRVQGLPEKGLDLQVASVDTEWYRNMIKEALMLSEDSFESNLSARIMKFERTLDITGGVYLNLKVECARCLKEIEHQEQIPFRFILEPVGKSKGSDNDDNSEDISETLDFSYYSGDEIDVGDLIRQHIVMAQPINYLCDENCRGLCDGCGVNLNEKKCKCKAEKGESPFEVLKDFKPVDK